VNDQQFAPCPWLLDDAGGIQPGRPQRANRCGADAARPELSNQLREERCLVGLGDPAILRSSDLVPVSSGGPWRRVALVAFLAALLVLGGGPVIGAIGPAVESFLAGGAAPSEEPSAELSTAPTPTPTPTTTPNPTPSATVTPSASATPSPSGGSGTTWVVKRRDTLYSICGQIGCGDWKILAELNNIQGPDYIINPGQVLQLP